MEKNPHLTKAKIHLLKMIFGINETKVKEPYFGGEVICNRITSESFANCLPFDEIYKTELNIYKEYLLNKTNYKENDFVEFEIRKFNKFLNDFSDIDLYCISEIESYKILIKRWIEYLENKLPALKNSVSTQENNQNKIPPPQKETEPTNSFRYNTPSQQDHIENILNNLKQNSVNIVFISDKVTLTEFKKTFNNTPLKNKTSLIDWQKSIASLRYFVKQFPFTMTDENRFKITAFCFTHKGNKLNYLQIENNKQVSEKDKKAIDNIFKHYPFIN